MESNSSRVFVIAAFIFVALFFIFLGISSYKERERRQLEEEANERRIHEELEKETAHNIDEVYERVEDAFYIHIQLVLHKKKAWILYMIIMLELILIYIERMNTMYLKLSKRSSLFPQL